MRNSLSLIRYNLSLLDLFYFIDRTIDTLYRVFDFLSRTAIIRALSALPLQSRQCWKFSYNASKLRIVSLSSSYCWPSPRIEEGDRVKGPNGLFVTRLLRGTSRLRSVFRLKAAAVTRCLSSFTFDTHCNGVNHHEVILSPHSVYAIRLGAANCYFAARSASCSRHKHEFHQRNR